MGRIRLFTGVLLALALNQATPPIGALVLRSDKAPPTPRTLFPRIKNRRAKFRPPKIIGKNKMGNNHRGKR